MAELSEQHPHPPRPPHPEHSGKTCIACGVDCSSRPRVRDQRGQYLCQECYDQLKAAKDTGAGANAGVVSGASADVERDAAAAAEGAKGASPTESRIPAGEADPYAIDEIPQIPCPSCGELQAQDFTVCASCGHDRKAAELDGTVAAEVAGPSEARRRRKINKKESREAARLRASETNAVVEYVKSVIMIAIGFGVVIGIPIAKDLDGVALQSFIFLGVMVIAGVFTFFTCSIWWIGFDAPLPQALLRSVGVFSISYVAVTFMVIIFPHEIANLTENASAGLTRYNFWIGFFVSWIIYMMLAAFNPDLERQDAILVFAASLCPCFAFHHLLVPWIFAQISVNGS
jgi:hypothetical protein